MTDTKKAGLILSCHGSENEMTILDKIVSATCKELSNEFVVLKIKLEIKLAGKIKPADVDPGSIWPEDPKGLTSIFMEFEDAETKKIKPMGLLNVIQVKEEESGQVKLTFTFDDSGKRRWG